MKNNFERFSHTSSNYQLYRPSYPQALITLLKEKLQLSPQAVIADIGSGTGLLTKLFLANGNRVYGVEPNKKMREAGEIFLKNFPNFISVEGSAEQTTLPADSVDYVTAGTAFHWFDQKQCHQEFLRILRLPGFGIFVWNVRDLHTKVNQDYENLILKYGRYAQETSARQFEKTIMDDFFSPFTMQTYSFPQHQFFNWEGFKGRLLSTSYALQKGEPRYEEMIDDLQKIFNVHAHLKKIKFSYLTKIYFGQLK
ncbi:MAG: class I SAM-dependent methyltransferase [Gammaproteobacteria bacterium]|nr:class I SAM-dependent methyltransferase [Gammaproteobacteria bacterium]